MTSSLSLIFLAALACVVPSLSQQAATDILFLIDASSSINQDRFYGEVLSYTERVVDTVAPGSQIGMLTFNQQVYETIPFKEYNSTEWQKKISRIRERDVVTFRCCSPFAEALEKADSIMKSQSKNEEKVVLLFTDGMPYQNPKDPAFPGRKYAYKGTKEDEQNYLHTVVPEVAKNLKDDGTRLVVFAHPGVNVKSGDQIDPNIEYFSGSDTILGAEGNTKVCVDLQRFKPQTFCKRSDNFPIVSSPVEDNLVSISSWDEFQNATTRLGCEALKGIACAVETTSSPTTLSPTSLSPTSTTPTGAPSLLDVPSTQSPTLPDDGSCSDGILNGNETGLDCGGSQCDKCEAGQECLEVRDCKAGLSCVHLSSEESKLVCQAPSCNDKAVNGNETDMDCGGSDCPKCSAGNVCVTDNDCDNDLVCGNSNICEEPGVVSGSGSIAGWIGVAATIVVLVGYAVVGVVTGVVTAGDSSGGLAETKTKTCLAEVSSVVTLYEFINFGQFCSVGALLQLPGVPANFYYFARLMGFTLMNFVPVGPNPTTDAGNLRRLAEGSNPDTLAVYAASWSLRPEYLVASVTVGFCVAFVVIMFLYVLSIKVQVCVASKVQGKQVKHLPLTLRSVSWASCQALVQLIYYGIFPVFLVITYQFLQASRSGVGEASNDVVIGMTVLAAILLALIVGLTVLGMFRSWGYSDLQKQQDSSDQAETQRSKRGSKAKGANKGEEAANKKLEEARPAYRKLFYRLVVDWRHECRLFWIDRVVLSAVRGIIVGVVGTQLQAVGVLVLALLYCMIECYFQPYRSRVQNLTGLFIGLCYVPGAILLVVFNVEPVPYTAADAQALGTFAIVLHLVILLGMMVLLLANYCISWRRGLSDLKNRPAQGGENGSSGEPILKSDGRNSNEGSRSDSAEFFDVDLEDVSLQNPEDVKSEQAKGENTLVNT